MNNHHELTSTMFQSKSANPFTLVCFIACTGLLPAAATATSPEDAEPPAKPSQWIHAGRVLDVVSGQYAEDQLITIVGGKIAAIEPIPKQGEADRHWIDWSHLTVLPGLIDTHTHLCDNSHMGEQFDHWALPAASFGIAGVVNAQRTLQAGFTSVRDLSAPYYACVALRDAINDGWVPGPRMHSSGQMITMTGGHGDWGGWMAAEHQVSTPAEAVADGVDEVRKAVRLQIQHGVDWIKLSATGGFGTTGTVPAASTYTQAEIQAAVEEAAKRGIGVAAHAHGEDGILNAIAAGVRSVEHGTLMDTEAIKQLKQNNTFVVMDLLAAHYDLIETQQDFSDKQLSTSNETYYQDYAANFKRAYQAGVRLAFGTDAGVYPHGRNAEQFQLMVDAGMSPIDAIRSATSWAAELMGAATQVGQIKVGMWADMVAVHGDPLTDIGVLPTVQQVMKGGQLVPLN